MPTLKEFFQMAITFAMVVFAWIFFRAKSLEHALQYVLGIFSKSLFSMPQRSAFMEIELAPSKMLSLLILFILIEWLGREQQYAIANLGLKWRPPLRWALYISIAIVILLFSGKAEEFIYFQF